MDEEAEPPRRSSASYLLTLLVRRRDRGLADPQMLYFLLNSGGSINELGRDAWTAALARRQHERTELARWQNGTLAALDPFGNSTEPQFEMPFDEWREPTIVAPAVDALMAPSLHYAHAHPIFWRNGTGFYRGRWAARNVTLPKPGWFGEPSGNVTEDGPPQSFRRQRGAPRWMRSDGGKITFNLRELPWDHAAEDGEDALFVRGRCAE